jgi:hypothetical protein
MNATFSGENVNVLNHHQITTKLSELANQFLLGNVSFNKILEFCQKSRKDSRIARQALISTLKMNGVLDQQLLDKVQNIDPYEQKDSKELVRRFESSDGESIVSAIAINPEESIYNVLTNKVHLPEDNDQTNNSNYQLLYNQMVDFSKMFNLSPETFKGAKWIDADGVRHKFGNPNDLQVNNWFHYTLKIPSNSQDLYEHEQISTRVYLHPKIEYIYTVWTDLLKKLETLPAIRKYGYQSKTPNFFNFSPLDFAKMKNQHDRILLYFGDNTREESMKIITEYISQHPEYFEPCHSLASPLLDNSGKQVNFAFTSDEPQSGSFNQNQSEIVESIMDDFIAQNYPSNFSRRELARIISSDTNVKTAFTKFLKAEYPSKLNKAGFRTDNIAFLKSSSSK